MATNDPFSDEELLLPPIFSWTWPSSLSTWAFWGMGLVSMGYGIVSSLAMMDLDGFCLIIIGLVVMGCCVRNPFAVMMEEYVPDNSDGWSVQPLPPMDPSQWHLDRPRWNAKYEQWLPDPLTRFEMDGPEIRCEKVEDGWAVYYGNEELMCEKCQGNRVPGSECAECGGVDLIRFDNEVEASEKMEKLIARHEGDDAQSIIFTEHPRNHRYRKLYNATPPQITARFLYHAMAVLFVAGMFLGMPSEDRGNYATYATALVMFGAIGTIISQWYNKGVIEAWDTVTSIVKFLDEGHAELVGQVRPANFLPMDLVHVDGYRDPDWTFDNLAVWSWNYRVYKCKEERYYDEQSKSWKTKTVCYWQHVRGARDQRDFMLHDGSGGIIVDFKSFENRDIGRPIWSRTEPGKMGGDGLYLDGDIRKHEWTLWALQLGDPVYLMGRIRSRPFDEIPKGMVANNSSRVHHTLMAVGEDAVRRRAKLRKGTEFSVLKPKTSALSRLGVFLMLAITGFVILLVGS